MIYWQCKHCGSQQARWREPLSKVCSKCGQVSTLWVHGMPSWHRSTQRAHEAKWRMIQRTHRLYLRELVEFDDRDSPVNPKFRI